MNTPNIWTPGESRNADNVIGQCEFCKRDVGMRQVGRVMLLTIHGIADLCNIECAKLYSGEAK